MRKVFIVDDDPQICKGLQCLINWQDFDCVLWLFQKSTEVLDEALRVHPDIIITDIRMPLLNGLDLIGQLKEAGLDAKFIILSGFSDFEYAQKGITLGVHAVHLCSDRRPLFPRRKCWPRAHRCSTLHA